MKRNSLTTAVVAGIAGVAGFAGLANAVDLNPDGLGQVLIYPYYTVNKSQDTLFTVVNTTAVGKAVKVRFLEGYNSREVLDFNLFLSPHDVWTARVSQTSDDGGGAVFTTDKSCTSPNIPPDGQPFSTAGFDGSGADPDSGTLIPADGGPTDVTRTREGYLELITMGDIPVGSALASDITHVLNGQADGGMPPDCSQGTLDNDAPGSVVAPTTGGLFGSGAIVNVGEGTFFSYNADAIDGFTEIALYHGTESLQPSLQDANNPSLVTAAGTIARAFVFINGNLVTADYALGVDAVSAVLMSDTLYNEFFVDPDFGADTDWVVMFPTKRFYVDDTLYSRAPAAPFVEAFHSPGESNVTVGINLYDREEGHTTPHGWLLAAGRYASVLAAVRSQRHQLPDRHGRLAIRRACSVRCCVRTSRRMAPMAGWISTWRRATAATSLPGGVDRDRSRVVQRSAGDWLHGVQRHQCQCQSGPARELWRSLPSSREPFLHGWRRGSLLLRNEVV